MFFKVNGTKFKMTPDGTLFVYEKTERFGVWKLVDVITAKKICRKHSLPDPTSFMERPGYLSKEFMYTVNTGKNLRFVDIEPPKGFGRKLVKFLRTHSKLWVPFSVVLNKKFKSLDEKIDKHILILFVAYIINNSKGDKLRIGLRWTSEGYEICTWQGNSGSGDYTQPVPDHINYALHGTDWITALKIILSGFDSSKSTKGARAFNGVPNPNCLGRSTSEVYVIFNIRRMLKDGVKVGLSADGHTIIAPYRIPVEYVDGVVPVDVAKDAWAKALDNYSLKY